MYNWLCQTAWISITQVLQDWWCLSLVSSSIANFNAFPHKAWFIMFVSFTSFFISLHIHSLASFYILSVNQLHETSISMLTNQLFTRDNRILRDFSYTPYMRISADTRDKLNALLKRNKTLISDCLVCFHFISTFILLFYALLRSSCHYITGYIYLWDRCFFWSVSLGNSATSCFGHSVACFTRNRSYSSSRIVAYWQTFTT